MIEGTLRENELLLSSDRIASVTTRLTKGLGNVYVPGVQLFSFSYSFRHNVAK